MTTEFINITEFFSTDNITDSSNPKTAVTSSTLAYVIYTSGTTGNPKGVMVEHKGVINLIHNEYEIFDLSYSGFQNCLQFFPLTFDASVFEMFFCILFGHKLCIVAEEQRKDLHNLNQLLVRNKIQIATLPPSLLTNSGINTKFLKTLVLAGEPPTQEVLDRYLDKKIKVINGYGPTEATVCASCNIYDKNGNKNIGKALNNVQLYVLDKDLQPLPIGAVGELYIGGVGVARGYLNKPELTAERFVSNPFALDSRLREDKMRRGSSLYKTGDLVRWLPDGNLEYIGRSDFQVKIRGFRIELGEIENQLLKYPGIKQAVALVQEKNGSKFLVAYYVAATELDHAQLSKHLQLHLPEYMVPHILIYMVQLPINVNGKLDRKALPVPNLVDLAHYVAPRNELEQKICVLYAEVLGLSIEQVGIKDDFFKMGGDSISSIQLAYRLKQKLALTIGVNDIFAYRSVECLVKNITSNQNAKKNSGPITHEDYPIGTAELLPIQEWFFANIKSGLLKNYNHWNQAFIIKTPKLDLKILNLSIKKLLQHHDAFRLRFKNFTQRYINLDLTAEVENIKIINIANYTDQQIRNKLIELQSNFHIATGPVYVIAYLHGYKDKTARLFFAFHHLLVDSVSWRLLTHDIEKLYELLQDNRNANKTSQELLGPKGTSYRQWTTAIKNYQPNLDEISYWDSVLRDYEHIPKITNQDSWSEFLLPADFTQQLMTTANTVYDTQASDILLAALTRTLAQVFNRQINHVTLEGHGREEIDARLDVTKTMGWFTSMYPVKLINQPTIKELIKTTKEKLKNIPNKGIAYGAIKGYQHLPNISFNYLGQISYKEEFWNIVDHMISVDPENHRNNIIDIYGYVANGILKFYITCNAGLNFNAKLFAARFKINLEEFITHCITNDETTFSSNIPPFLEKVKLRYAHMVIKKPHDHAMQEKIDSYLRAAENIPCDLLVPKPIANVLLTGSTGFLGCNLLRQLLQLTNYTIYLPIRASSHAEAIDRISKKFKFYFDEELGLDSRLRGNDKEGRGNDKEGRGNDKEGCGNDNPTLSSSCPPMSSPRRRGSSSSVFADNAPRIIVFAADLEKPNLGLSLHEYQELAHNIDSTIHAAALVKHYGEYKTFYSANVQATINLLEFTKLTTLKDFHYVSSRTILDRNYNPTDAIYIEDDTANAITQDNIYLKTKAQAENQTIKYRAYGINSNIYRVGALAYIAENLRMQENLEEQGFLNWVKYIFKLQCIAKEISTVEVSPTDLTAQALVKLFDKKSLNNQIYHVFNPNLFDISKFKNNEYNIKTLSIDNFIDRIASDLRRYENDNLLMKFLLFQGWMDEFKTENIATIEVLSHRTQHILQHLDFAWTHAAVETFFNKYYQLLKN